MTGSLKALDQVEFIEESLKRPLPEKVFLLHPFLDVGKIDKGDKFHKKLPVERGFRGNQSSSHVQPFFQIPERFLHQILVPVKFQGLDGILDVVAQQGKIAVVSRRLLNDGVLRDDLSCAFGRIGDVELLGIVFLMFRNLLLLFEL